MGSSSAKKKTNAREKPAIGSAVRHRRKQLNMTMKDLAAATGLSVGFISQVERNLTSPSLSSLASIARVLKADIGYFMDVPKVSDSFFSEKNRTFSSMPDSRIKYCRLSRDLPGSQFNTLLIKTPPGVVSERTSHEGEEQIYMLKGKGFVVLNDERFDLEPGDSIHYMSETYHQFGNDGETDSLILFIGTQVLF